MQDLSARQGHLDTSHDGEGAQAGGLAASEHASASLSQSLATVGAAAATMPPSLPAITCLAATSVSQPPAGVYAATAPSPPAVAGVVATNLFPADLASAEVMPAAHQALLRVVMRALRVCAAAAKSNRQPTNAGTASRSHALTLPSHGHACFVALPPARRDALVSLCYTELLEVEMEMLADAEKQLRDGGDADEDVAVGTAALRSTLSAILPGVLCTPGSVPSMAAEDAGGMPPPPPRLPAAQNDATHTAPITTTR